MIKMSSEGFTEYKHREFCNDIRCPVQIELNKRRNKTDEYERIRQTCTTNCRYTAWQFHHWLIEKGYSILKPKKFGGEIKWSGE